jgi:hypothetical protein
VGTADLFRMIFCHLWCLCMHLYNLRYSAQHSVLSTFKIFPSILVTDEIYLLKKEKGYCNILSNFCFQGWTKSVVPHFGKYFICCLLPKKATAVLAKRLDHLQHFPLLIPENQSCKLNASNKISWRWSHFVT